MRSSGPAIWRGPRSTAHWTGSRRAGGSGTNASTSSTRCWSVCSPPRSRRGATVAEHNELHFTRTFEAPRELVFACMTDADHLAHFWGPAGVSAPRDRITLDARPGGRFEPGLVGDSGGRERRSRDVFDEVRPPELLVWTGSLSGMKVRSEFVALGPDRTQ